MAAINTVNRRLKSAVALPYKNKSVLMTRFKKISLWAAACFMFFLALLFILVLFSENLINQKPILKKNSGRGIFSDQRGSHLPTSARLFFPAAANPGSKEPVFRPRNNFRNHRVLGGISKNTTSFNGKISSFRY